MAKGAVRSIRRSVHSFLFAGIVFAGAIGACGPHQGEGQQGPGPTTSPAPTTSVPSTPTAAPTGSDAVSKPPILEPGPGPHDHEPMKPISASMAEAELREIGLDPQNLPPLNKLEPAMLRKVMKPFAKALGVQCSHCHDTRSFKAPTPNKKIAAHMWNDFVRTLAMQDGSVLFCDSCHQGKAKVLDRSAMPALGEWMKENYVGKLVRRDGQEHGCATCHGDPFEGRILSRRWK